MESTRIYPEGPDGPASRLEVLGITQEVTPARQEHAMTELERAEAYAVKSQTHLWLLMLTYKVPEGFLDSQDGIVASADPTAILDPDALMGRPVLGCYVCEQAYDRRIRHRRCPGEPR